VRPLLVSRMKDTPAAPRGSPGKSPSHDRSKSPAANFSSPPRSRGKSPAVSVSSPLKQQKNAYDSKAYGKAHKKHGEQKRKHYS